MSHLMVSVQNVHTGCHTCARFCLGLTPSTPHLSPPTTQCHRPLLSIAGFISYVLYAHKLSSDFEKLSVIVQIIVNQNQNQNQNQINRQLNVASRLSVA